MRSHQVFSIEIDHKVRKAPSAETSSVAAIVSAVEPERLKARSLPEREAELEPVLDELDDVPVVVLDPLQL